MFSVRSPQVTLHGSDTALLRIDIAARPNIFTAGFVLLWLAGWGLSALAMVSHLVRDGGTAPPLSGIWLLVWMLAGAPILYALLWAAAGRRETIVLRGGALVLERRVGPLVRSREFPPLSIQNLRLARAGWRILADLAAVRQFWIGGAGRIVFEGGGRTYACGAALADEDALRILEEIAGRVPMAPEGAATLPGRALRGGQRWVMAYLTMGVLLPTVTLPIRLAITDRAICFCRGHAAPQSPVDVSRLQPSGRLYLVPVDDFPPETAQSIARHFAQRFGTRIEMQPRMAAPRGVFNAGRHQMDAAALLSVLEQQYPALDPRTVVIALTTADMYIPHLSWRYAFSYRRADRLAVVSSARMDRGCLGLLPASEARQLARVRKMVGKNVGVLYYGLPLSNDPASLLYAHIGGPQELDAMGEDF
jgi:predicted Zn-dependent protease